MTTIELNFEDAQEAMPVPSGRYDLQVTAAETKESSKGKPMIQVSLGFTGGSKEEQNAPNITHFISLPAPEDEAKSVNFKVLMLKRFLELFHIPYESGAIDVDGLVFSMIGAKANAEVKLDEPDEKGNVYNRLVTPRISNEGGSGRMAPPKR